jgi:hypothetical protein
MRCLQCGVEMALLKKLRNSTEFCSDECRQKYQDESNQMAVSRLMQQRRPKPARAALGAAGSPPGAATGVVDRAPAAPVAVATITEPPLAEFLPQTAIAEIEAHPVATKVDWQARAGSQILPALADDVFESLLALQLTQIQERYAPRGPRPAPVEDLLPMVAPGLWSQTFERQPLPALTPNPTQAWNAIWPAEWSGLVELIREDSAAAEAPVVPEVEPVIKETLEPVSQTVAEPATVPAPVEAAAPAPVAVTPPAAPPIKLPKPGVVPAEPAEPAPVVESVAMPQPALRTPEAVMLPLRPRIAIAPRNPEPEAAPPKKAAAMKPILVPKSDEISKAPAKPPEEKAKAPETKIPDVRLEPLRPDKTPVEAPKAAAAETKSTETKPAESKGKGGKAVEGKAPEAKPAESPIAAPTFGATPKSSAATGLWHRMPWWERCAAVAVFLLSIGGWLINGRPAEDKRSSRSISLPSPAAPAPGMGSDSWASERATDLAGAALNRQLSLYRPSKTMKDYVVEFQGAIQERALGWIVRAKDSRNYYCIKLEVDKAGATKLIRFGVIDGKEDAHTQLPLSMLPKPENGTYKVRVEAKGPKISTYINGQAVDLWVDERLPQGAAGFTNERGERALVKSVQVSF